VNKIEFAKLTISTIMDQAKMYMSMAEALPPEESAEIHRHTGQVLALLQAASLIIKRAESPEISEAVWGTWRTGSVEIAGRMSDLAFRRSPWNSSAR
jgi:hypothetical protein